MRARANLENAGKRKIGGGQNERIRSNYTIIPRFYGVYCPLKQKGNPKLTKYEKMLGIKFLTPCDKEHIIIIFRKTVYDPKTQYMPNL